MKRNFSLFLAIFFTIFSMPLDGLTVFAEDSGITPDKAYEINTTIKQEDGKGESVADKYFENKGVLLEKDGKNYIQMTTNSGNYIKSFKNNHGEAIVIEDNKDGSKTLQLLVDNDLSNMNLDMHIIVPGIYDAEHNAQLEFDKTTKKEIAIGNNKLIINKDNKNGPEAKPSPVIEVKEETKKEPIKFKEIKENDPALDKNKTKVKQEGKNGEKEIIYEVTYTDGKETNRKVITENITVKPVNKITLIGTKEPEAEIEIKEETKTEEINFKTIEEEDASLEKGQTKVKQKGINGSKEVTYQVTYTDGKETNRKPIGKEKITKQPVDEIILVGTKELEKIEDGVYGINYNVDYDGDDFSQYFEQQATLKVENGKYYLEFKHNSISFINEITIPQGEVKVINEDKEKEMRVVGFNIGSDLSKPVDMGLKMFYGRTHDVKLNFDLDSLKPIEVNVKEETKTEEIEFETLKENDPTMDLGETKVKTKGENGSKEVTYKVHYINGEEYYRAVDVEKEKIITSPVNEVILVGTNLNPDNLNDGVYRVNYEVDYNGDDFSQYFEQPALLKVENNKHYLEFKHNSASFINGITLPIGTLDVINEDKEKGTRVVGFNVGKDLTKPVNMGLEMFYGRTHDVKLNFDLDSLKIANLKVDTEIKTEETPFKTVEENDPTMELGDQKVKTEGKNGSKKLNYEVTYIDGKEHYRKVINESVIKDPVSEIILVGTKEVKEETKTEEIKFETVREESDKLEIGKTTVKTEGKNGEKEITYEVTYVEDEETGRKVKSESIIKEPINEVVLIGTKKVDQLKPDKVYEISTTIKQEDGESNSVANDFFQDKGLLLEKDDKTYIQLTVDSGDMVKSFKGKYGEAIVVRDVKGGSKTLQLRVENNLSNMPLDMHIVVPEGAIPGFPGYDEEHKALLVFDKESKQEIEVSDLRLAAFSGNKNGPEISEEESIVKTEIVTEKEPIKFKTIKKNDPKLEKGKTKIKQKGKNGEVKVTYEVTYKNGIETKRKVKNKSIINKPVNEISLVGTKSVKTQKNNQLVPDETYKINYTIKQEDGIKDSVANDFFTNTGILLKKEGKTYLQMAIENGDMVKDLKGKYGEAIIVKKEKDGSTVVQLRVDNDLANMLLEMHVIVPEGAIPGFPGYNEYHKALLVFDKGSKQEIEVGDLRLAAIAGNKNGPKVSPENNTGLRMGNGLNGNGGDGNPKSKLGTNHLDNIATDLKNEDLNKPEFGSNKNKDNNQNNSNNPKTGDLTNVWLYAFLLAGSMLVLAMKFRRKTI